MQRQDSISRKRKFADLYQQAQAHPLGFHAWARENPEKLRELQNIMRWFGEHTFTLELELPNAKTPKRRQEILNALAKADFLTDESKSVKERLIIASSAGKLAYIKGAADMLAILLAIRP